MAVDTNKKVVVLFHHFECKQKKQPLRVAFKYRGRESNPHELWGSQDFKSCQLGEIYLPEITSMLCELP